MFSTQEEYECRLIDMWNSNAFDSSLYDEIKDRGFAIQKTIHTESILFVGINPSMAKDAEIGNLFYEEEFLDKHQYFRPFINIASEVDERWSHIDLLFVRETNQKTVKNLCDKNSDFRRFAIKQYEIAVEIIKRAVPKVIIINNTLARMFIEGKYGSHKFPLEFDNTIGTYRISDGELSNTPLFFTSMLSGQRALDNGSKERLVWQIKLAINKL